MTQKPLFIKDGGKLVKIDANTLLVLEVDNNYVRFITADKEYSCKITLENALNDLPPGMFVKVNRACAVAVQHIDSLDRLHVKVAGQELVIARGYYDRIVEHLSVLGAGSRRSGVNIDNTSFAPKK